jgi:hypothetical protein
MHGVIPAFKSVCGAASNGRQLLHIFKISNRIGYLKAGFE